MASQCNAGLFLMLFIFEYTRTTGFTLCRSFFASQGENDLQMKQSTLLPQAISTLAARGIYALY